MHWARKPLFLIGLLAACAVAGARVGAQSASGADVKAAFVFNFAKFVEWPAPTLPPGQAIVIGVLGSNKIADALARVVDGRMINSRSVQVRRVAAADDMAMLQLLFIDGSESVRVGDIVRKLGGASVLTVSDAPNFLNSGGIIQLRTEDDRVRFDVDLEHARGSQLVINSKLLALAGIVNPAKP